VPEQQTSLAHWRQLLGDDLVIASRWLAPTKVFASAIPNTNASAPWLRVVEDEPYRYRAFDDHSNRVIEIERADAAVFALDWRQVVSSLSNQAGFLRSQEPSPITRAWHFATHQPQIGFAFPIYLGRGPVIDSLTHISDQTDQPFVLLRMRTQNINALCGRLLRERRGLLLALTGLTCPSDDGAIHFTASALERIEAFVRTYLPEKPIAAPKSGFPTPPGCTWSSIRIRFMDLDSVSISVAGVVGRYHYSQMGFANRNNQRPNVQWELLQSFAQGNGVLTWDSPGASRKNPKRRERLAETLSQFFGIESDPIRWMPDQGAWQTLFTIEP
jgi:hypothetical protein